MKGLPEIIWPHARYRIKSMNIFISYHNKLFLVVVKTISVEVIT